MCGGDFMSKNLEEAMDFLSYVAEVSREWDELNAREVGRMKSQPNAPNAKAGMYTLNEDIDIKAKVTAMARRLEDGGSGGESSQVREVKAVIALRSGKEVDLPTSKLEHEPENETEKEKREEIKGKRKGNSAKKKDLESTVNEEPERTINQEDMMKKHTPPPFPQALHVMIGGMCVEKALLDLGASVNLLPYSVYQQLGLGELKPTSITLSLADRSMKIPRGMVEDVLVQVNKFYYPVDFVVLDTDPIIKRTNCVPIILGRPFLATSNAIINCRNGVMQLTFGNMMIELNIFYLCKKQFHSEEEEGPEEVCIIDNLVEEHCDKKMLEDLNESLGILMKGYLNPQICLLLCPLGRGGRKFCLYSMGRRRKKLLRRSPQSLF
ncbi:hypothetical protein CK203_109412 [Vitis vinifera]|uniref:Uncharacterized protein n=1 Tax=Vitis vinifera TaxID=29760 RepID=A0A438CVY9_VITVI|nr:hypothetical protein CK203_109412 [Vitis vinifera]